MRRQIAQCFVALVVVLAGVSLRRALEAANNTCITYLGHACPTQLPGRASSITTVLPSSDASVTIGASAVPLPPPSKLVAIGTAPVPLPPPSKLVAIGTAPVPLPPPSKLVAIGTAPVPLPPPAKLMAA
ncbi:MAG TPA: hypothetical protein VG206_15935 [Terriglobia bacterium]|nr:hypothetical protein [Terriglobia bacterium]